MRKTLSKDRDIEWGFCKANLEPATGLEDHLLDFGPMPPSAPTSRLGIERGYYVTAVGLEDIFVPFQFIFTYIQADINSIEQPGRFDVVLNISTVEHVGLGRYGDPIDPDGDLEAMQRLRRWMRPNGCQILTIPVGLDSVIGQYHRVYGEKRLWKLLGGYQIIKAIAWVKDVNDDQWCPVPLSRALEEPPTHLPVEKPLYLYYAIGGFVLGR